MCRAINKNTVNIKSVQVCSDIYNNIFDQANKLGFLGEYANENKLNLIKKIYLEKYVKDILTNDFKLEILKYFINHRITANYFEKHTTEYNAEIKPTLDHLKSGKTLSSEGYVNLLSIIFNDSPGLLINKLHMIDYRNINLKD